ncbi:MAG: diguanylate cyclase [Proteobacteria bacterium]|nr:diguanylate cyclase [Pseudomonadota bacterium]
MVNLNKMQKGWLYAFVNVLIFFGLGNIFISYSTQVLEVNKIIFALSTYATCSFCLLYYAKDGKLSMESMRSVDTWAYGVIMLSNYFISLNLFSITSATEASLIQRFSVVFSIFFSWFFLRRKPTRQQLIGLVMIFTGVLYVVGYSPSDKLVYLYVLMFLTGIFQSLRIFIAEFHRPHKRATQDPSVKTRCRVIGYVMFVITLLFGTLVGMCTWLQAYIPESYKMNLVIEFKDFFSYQSVVAGAIMGIFIYTPLRFFEFASAEKIKAENYLAVVALSFISTWFWEWATSSITGLSLKELSTQDIIAGIVITVGALIMAINKMTGASKQGSTLENFLKADSQDLESIEETRELIANSLEHFKADIKQTAKALGVPIKVIGAILEDSDKVLTFKKEVLRKVASNYRKKVANSDALTGLVNRVGFMTALKAAKFEADQFSLLMIDLNKFKPVNDTYGHAAGDFVLQETGKRLHGLFKDNSLATRLGGDEFSVLLIGSDKADAKQKLKKVKQEMEKDIFYEKNKINISGSIGIASYPEDTKSAEEMIKIADDGMYRDKGGRRR